MKMLITGINGWVATDLAARCRALWQGVRGSARQSGDPEVQSVGVPRHRFIAAGSVDLPLDFAFSAKFLYQSPTQVRSLISSAVRSIGMMRPSWNKQPV